MTRTRKLPLSNSVLSALALCLLAAVACGSDGAPASNSDDGIPTPPPEDLTASQVLSLARTSANNVVSYRASGDITADVEGEGSQEGTQTIEWTAPDRSRTISLPATGPASGLTHIVRIGDRSYLGFMTSDGTSADGLEWQEAESDPDNRNIVLSLLEPADAVLTGIETVNGVEAYRITGAPTSGEANIQLEVEGQDVLFISTSDFRLLRLEQEATVREIPPEPGPGQSDDLVSYTVQMTMEFEYFDKPIVIEPPDEYMAMNRDTDEPTVDWTPTPTAAPRPLATATPAPFPFPTFAPDDPARHIPFHLNDAPYYDKLELGNDVVVSYPYCSSLFRIGSHLPQTIIYYMPDGSYASNGQATFILDPETADEFIRTEYFSDAGRAAIEAVLNDPDTMRRVIENMDREVRCPEELLRFTGDTFPDLPDNEKLVIDEETIARFEPCDTEGRTLATPVLIAHLPNKTMIGITPGEERPTPIMSAGEDPGSFQDLWALHEDAELMEQLAELAPKDARCG